MSGQALQAELTSLAQEAKRKNPDIRTAAEKSLQDLKSLPSTSEQQLAADLSRRPNFIDPFLLACATKNPKYAASAANCLQRLVIIKGLPKSRLKDVLDAFNACTSLSLDVQLKVLQALPTLAQSYADDLKGHQLAGALQVCAALQNVKTPTVSGVATATLQQLVVSVFEKVVAEDARGADLPTVVEVPGENGSIPVRDAAHDAYRVFLDIALAIEGRRPKFVHFADLSPISGLELIGACMQTHSIVFVKHIEQTDIIRNAVMPFLIRVISERQGFAITLRAIRVASLVLRQHLDAMPQECEIVIGLLTHMLDSEAAAGWKRAMCMEVFRMIYTEPGLAMHIYQQYDASKGKKPIIKDNISTFVRISTEKPAVIGLSQQSSIPTGPANQKESVAEQVIAETEGGVAGVIGAALGVGGSHIPGISSQWSVPKTQCIDQLDKSDPPQLPETYVYSLVLECLNGLSENLAKVVLPLSVQHENVKSPKLDSPNGGSHIKDGESPSEPAQTRKKRSQSYRARTVPLNPLELEATSAVDKAKAIANLVEECWPALLATYSTFLNAALDNDYYRALIRSYQRFVQVSGLMRLTTARDAFLTTLGKSAVPSNFVNATMTAVVSPGSETPNASSIYSNAKGLLSVDSFASQISSNDRRPRSAQGEQAKPALTTRNLLCLRALLNVAIAIGPTLDSSFTIIFETLQQAGSVLNTMNASQISRDARTTSGIGPEVAAVEATAMRLFESTADYPNDAFSHVLSTLCGLLDGRVRENLASSPPSGNVTPITSPRLSFTGRKMSVLPGLNTDITLSTQDYVFVLTRLGELADLNTARFTTYGSAESGWKTLVERLVDLAVNASVPTEARRLAADILSRCSVAIAKLSMSEEPEDAASAQKMVLSSLRLLILQLYGQSDDLTNVDVDIHAKMLEAVRSILEECGEALASGWDTILAILSSVFDDEEQDKTESAVTDAGDDKAWMHLSSQVVAPYLSRSAFGVMQLVCSDFLSALPETCFSPLIEILYRFVTQQTDLNISLTTISLFWDVSDFLVKHDAVAGLNQLATTLPDSRLTHPQIISQQGVLWPAQWLLALYRIADVVADKRSEVRNSAFQTLLRIFKNHADDLSTSGWDLCFETLLLKILSEDVLRQKTSQEESTPIEVRNALDATTKTLLEETGLLVAENLVAISSSKQFDRLWAGFLDLIQKYLTCSSAVVIAALFTCTTTLLRGLTADDQQWKPMIREAGIIASAGIPKVQGHKAEQEAYLAYADCVAEFYRLTEKSITAEELRTMALNLYECVCASSGVSRNSDVHNMTPLQTKILGSLKRLRTDLDYVPSTMIKIASTFVRLPFDDPSQPKPKTDLTFVALSKASMDWIVNLVTTHQSHSEIFISNSVALSIESLVVPMSRKYTWTANGKGPAPWQKAILSSLAIIEPVLHHLRTLAIPQETQTRIWRAIVAVGHEIMHADLSGSPTTPSLLVLETDETADCASLVRLRDMIIPALGSARLPDAVRTAYMTSLFQASIVHAPEPGDVPVPTPDNDKAPFVHLLNNLTDIRLGRVRDPPSTPREEMAYLCLTELLSLVSVGSSISSDAEISNGSSDREVNKEVGEDRKRLARAAAPWMVLRLALPLKSYIADQPLRGSMPMPLSQVEEVVGCLRRMREVRCLGSLLSGSEGSGGGDGGGSKVDMTVGKRYDSERAHLKWLFPLVVRAVAVAGDQRHGNAKVLEELRAVLDVVGGSCMM